MTAGKTISNTIHINATTEKVWHALTNPATMSQWMSDKDIGIITDWKVGSPVIIRGTAESIYFENKGTVITFEPLQKLAYSHLSSLSNLPDKPENYTLLEFTLIADGNQTTLNLDFSNFPTESIYHHFAFYWNVAPHILKKLVEEQ